MNITLRKIKIVASMSQETLCYTADICLDGKTVGSAYNQGCGGPDDYHFADKAVGASLRAYAASLPPVDMSKYGTEPLPMDLELLIGDLLNAHEAAEHEKKVAAQRKRWCKTKTVFRLKGDDFGVYRTINATYSPNVKSHIVAKYGDKVEEIVNELV